MIRGYFMHKERRLAAIRRSNMLIFSHPDCTVGSGITPDQLLIAGHGLSGFLPVGNCSTL